MNKTTKTLDRSLVILTIVIGILSYIFNLGWYRLILFIPFFAYNCIVLTLNIIYVSRGCSNKNAIQRAILYIGLLTYLLFNVLFNDGVDIGPPYCFFGLIKLYGNGNLLYITQVLSIMSLFVSWICIVANFIIIITTKSKDIQ